MCVLQYSVVIPALDLLLPNMENEGVGILLASCDVLFVFVALGGDLEIFVWSPVQHVGLEWCLCIGPLELLLGCILWFRFCFVAEMKLGSPHLENSFLLFLFLSLVRLSL